MPETIIELFVKLQDGIGLNPIMQLSCIERQLERLGGSAMHNFDGNGFATMNDETFKISIHNRGNEGQVTKYLNDCGFEIVRVYRSEGENE